MALCEHDYCIDSLDDSGEDENFTVVTSKKNLKRKSEKDRNPINSSDDQTKTAKKSANTQLQPIVLQASDKTKKLASFCPMVIVLEPRRNRAA